MGADREVAAINSLLGMPVLSLATGNMIGTTRGVLIDPQNGVLAGLRLDRGWLPYDLIHSFGRDAIMAASEAALVPEGSENLPGRDASGLKGARVVAENGEVAGRICNVHLTLKPPPFLIYEVRGRSFLDWIFGRRIYIPASAGHVLSEDSARLVVPLAAVEQASPELTSVAVRAVTVRTFEPPADADGRGEDETIVRPHDEDETVVRLRDEDETVVRRPRTGR